MSFGYLHGDVMHTDTVFEDEIERSLYSDAVYVSAIIGM